MDANLLHLGSGALGLGLILPKFSHSNGVNIYISNRNDKNSFNKNDILKKKKSYLHRTIDYDSNISIKDFVFFEDRNYLKQIICEDKTIFLTTALKDGLKKSIDLISFLIHERNNCTSSYPLIFVACENAIKSSTIKELVLESLRLQFGDNYQIRQDIVFSNCVVDRICNAPFIDEGQNIVTVTEKYNTWIIEKPVVSNIHATFIVPFIEKMEGVEFVDNIEFYERRKKWLVNSIHHLIASYAYQSGYLSIHAFLSTPIGVSILEDLCEEVLEVYIYNEPQANIAQTRGFLKRLSKRLLSMEESPVQGALTRFTGEEKLLDFFIDFHRKVGEPTLKYFQGTKNSLFLISFISLALTELIAKKQFFSASN